MTNWKLHFAQKKSALKKKSHRRKFPCQYTSPSPGKEKDTPSKEVSMEMNK